MNKSAYVAALDAKSVWHGPVTSTDVSGPMNPSGEVKHYDVAMLVAKPNDSFAMEVQGFYVLNEGAANETVYPINQERKSTPPSQLKGQLRGYLNTLLSATRIKITIDNFDEENEFGIVTAYELNTTTQVVTTKRYFVGKVNGNVVTKEFAG